MAKNQESGTEIWEAPLAELDSWGQLGYPWTDQREGHEGKAV